MPRSTATLITLFIGILLGAYLQQYLSDMLLRHQFQPAPAAYPGQDYGYAMEDNRLADGDGEITWPNGDIYKGQFKNGMMHGEGTLTYANGDRYSGTFRYGQLHGEGNWTSANPDDDIHQYSGEWSNGRLMAARGDLRIYAPEEIAEFALYHQAELLDKTLAALQAGDDERIELYTLGIGAYGSEEVFQREINYLEKNFPARFGSETHSIWLSNSRRDPELRPMATLTSIERSLGTLAQRMNPEQDILFFYLTSHGSRNQTVSIEQPGLKLADLSAKQLRDMLDQSGIKWRVVVLSACYSGGFIKSLENEHTLVVTAAAADKTSFGCSDNSDFTYFGDAYFKQALAETDNFIDAYSDAKKIIAEWEEREGKDPSEPQMSAGSQIKSQLANWLNQRTD